MRQNYFDPNQQKKNQQQIQPIINQDINTNALSFLFQNNLLNSPFTPSEHVGQRFSFQFNMSPLSSAHDHHGHHQYEPYIHGITDTSHFLIEGYTAKHHRHIHGIKGLLLNNAINFVLRETFPDNNKTMTDNLVDSIAFTGAHELSAFVLGLGNEPTGHCILIVSELAEARLESATSEMSDLIHKCELDKPSSSWRERLGKSWIGYGKFLEVGTLKIAALPAEEAHQLEENFRDTLNTTVDHASKNRSKPPRAYARGITSS